MKIVYLKRTRCNSGGTERVVLNKTNYLVERGYDVTLVTTEFKEKPDFFNFSPKLKRVDLDINYSELSGLPLHKKIIQYFIKSRTHKRRLRELLLREKFDVVVSMFGNEVYWINDIKDGSRKINEVHFSRSFRSQLIDGDTRWSQRLISYIKNRKDIRAIKKFDLFAVLSNEDKPSWGDIPNIKTVYNGISLPQRVAALESKKAIAVGRLSYQKGFDMLIDAWAIIHQYHPDWQLEIYGSGDDKDALYTNIERLSLGGVVTICEPTPQIEAKMIDSSIYLMSSRYEGLPMVLLEAMSCGLPAVSFECKCGPKEIITDSKDGFLAPQDDIKTFADKVCRLISDDSMRREMGAAARKNIEERFSEEVVMKQWEKLFAELVDKK